MSGTTRLVPPDEHRSANYNSTDRRGQDLADNAAMGLLDPPRVLPSRLPHLGLPARTRASRCVSGSGRSRDRGVFGFLDAAPSACSRERDQQATQNPCIKVTPAHESAEPARRVRARRFTVGTLKMRKRGEPARFFGAFLAGEGCINGPRRKGPVRRPRPWPARGATVVESLETPKIRPPRRARPPPRGACTRRPARR